jgi:hypothetical protein
VKISLAVVILMVWAVIGFLLMRLSLVIPVSRREPLTHTTMGIPALLLEGRLKRLYKPIFLLVLPANMNIKVNSAESLPL